MLSILTSTFLSRLQARPKREPYASSSDPLAHADPVQLRGLSCVGGGGDAGRAVARVPCTILIADANGYTRDAVTRFSNYTA